MALTMALGTGRRAVNAARSPLRCSGLRRTSPSLPADSTSAELRRGSNPTKWTAEQLLFHMLFGYLVVRHPRILPWVSRRLPYRCSRAFAALLTAGTHPFHTITHVDALGRARVPRSRPHDSITSRGSG